MSTRTLLIMAGGTGGHIMPGLAVAHEMKARGWQVRWLGNPQRMEGRLVPQHGIDMVPLHFSGLRGKGLAAAVKLPLTLTQACLQASRALTTVKPDVVLGMGGYVAFPGGLMARVRGVPLVIHEQNAIAGTANRWLAKLASKVLVGFPGALPGGLMVGNPVREGMLTAAEVQQRYAGRTGPLRIAVIGGSLGASALNTTVPQALAMLDPSSRPHVVHQAGEQHIAAVEQAYTKAGVQAQCHAFIDDMAGLLADVDLVICRAGAMTVAEVAAMGVAALFVPLPHAIDDHQTANARYLSDCQGAWLQPQPQFTPQWLATWLSSLDRQVLAGVAQHAQEHASPNATREIADACEQAAGRKQ
jgi:UDP-N-acetylglucosamine--N-acetylmuramyl-(pentapeptide) pyrophosphoryl-undecaprenol N-acetylglucosamine transferase